MRRKIKWTVSMNFHGAEVSGEFYVDEVFEGEPSTPEIADYVRDEAMQHVEWGWEESTEEDEEPAS